MSCWGTQAPWWAAEILHHSWQSIIVLPLASASQMGFELVLNRRKPETYPIHKLICLQMFRSFHAWKAALKQPSSIFTISVFHLILVLDAQEVCSCYQSIHLSKALLCGLNTFVYCTGVVFSLKGQPLYQLFL